MLRHFSLSFKKDRLVILDQSGLPIKTKYIEIKNIGQSFRALRSLKVRGAPLIGVFAGYSIYISIKDIKTRCKQTFLGKLHENIDYLKRSRPTAVNLFWALDRIKKKVSENRNANIGKMKNIIRKEARLIHKEDIILCDGIASFGSKLIRPGDSILTHCNAGFLATSGQGTALAIIYKAHKLHRDIKVYADETRPLLQGARLTCWELSSRKIEVTLICDNMAAYLIKKGMINKVIVGADRITAAGFVANKIGTYNLAVLCKFHKVPFYVAAPSSSFDLTLKNSSDIPIEQRNPGEVKNIFGKAIAPRNVAALNPAFDVTPPHFISSIITEKGIIKPPFGKNIKSVIVN